MNSQEEKDQLIKSYDILEKNLMNMPLQNSKRENQLYIFGQIDLLQQLGAITEEVRQELYINFETI